MMLNSKLDQSFVDFKQKDWRKRDHITIDKL